MLNASMKIWINEATDETLGRTGEQSERDDRNYDQIGVYEQRLSFPRW
jgi:hypothetical protein